jgi:peptide/nickel transport system permease protein
MMKSLKEILRYPTALVGVIIILILVGISIYTVIALPYGETIRLWRASEADWYQNPRCCTGVVELLPKREAARNDCVGFGCRTHAGDRQCGGNGNLQYLTYTFPIEWQADGYPDDIYLFMKATFEEKAPFIGLTWIRPDGSELRLGNFSTGEKFTYRFGQDQKLIRKLGGLDPEIGLFTEPAVEGAQPKPVKGSYQLKMEVVTFDKNTTVDSELILYGKLAGLAGTDHLRRDLMLALLWGTPIALAFGLLAAVGTSLSQLIIAV